MTRGFWIAAAAGLALAGCDRPVPDDTVQGVGFGDYAEYQQTQIDTQRQQTAAPPAASLPVSEETIVPPTTAQIGEDEIADLAEAAIAEAETVAPQSAAVPVPAVPATDNSAISDEQDFDAVAARETIETDAERLERMAAERVEIAPTDLPDRPGSTGPNIVEYALSTSHPVGQQMYRRSAIGAGRHEDNCASYQSDDLAQQAFLSLGGPERDRQALDIDGDGYACDWNPEIYRNAARGG